MKMKIIIKRRENESAWQHRIISILHMVRSGVAASALLLSFIYLTLGIIKAIIIIINALHGEIIIKSKRKAKSKIIIEMSGIGVASSNVRAKSEIIARKHQRIERQSKMKSAAR